MKGLVLLLFGVLAVCALLVLLVGARRRALLRAPGAFPAWVVDESGRRRRAVGRYDAERLWLTGRWRLSRTRWATARHLLDLNRLPQSPEPGRVRLGVGETDRPDGPSLVLEVDEADAGALRAWAEAGPSHACRSWWRAPGQA